MTTYMLICTHTGQPCGGDFALGGAAVQARRHDARDVHPCAIRAREDGRLRPLREVEAALVRLTQAWL